MKTLGLTILISAALIAQTAPSRTPVRAGVPASWETLLSRIEQRQELTLTQRQTLMHTLEDARSEYQDAAKKFSVDHAKQIERVRELRKARDARGETAAFTDAETAELKTIDAAVLPDAKALRALHAKEYGIIIKALPPDMVIDLLTSVLFW